MTVLEKLELIREKAIAKMNEVIEAYSSRAEASKAAEVSEEVAESEALPEEPKEDSEEATAVETPRARKISPMTEPKSRKGFNGGVNRSQLVRDFFMKNKDARNKDAVEYLKSEHNVVVSPELVSIVRTKLNLPKRQKTERVSRSHLIREYFSKHPEARNKDAIEFLGKRGTAVTAELVSSVRAKMGTKPKRSKAKASDKAKIRKGKSDLPLPAIITKVLKGSRNGHKLADLADLALKAGYRYNGSRGRDGVIQNVYQAVNTLRERKSHPGWVGEMPVVLHDKESQRWKLNPKAKREVA
jgi:hypothetical protein